MLTLPRLFVLAVITLLAPAAAWGAEQKDIKEFVKKDFRDRIDGLKTGIYCKAFSCDFDIDRFIAEELEPQTYKLETVAWLKGTIPGLKGSAKRTLNLIGSYTKGTCIVKDIKAASDVTENNNGWGASKIESVFKGIEIPKHMVLTKEDCAKVDGFISSTQAFNAAMPAGGLESGR